MARIDRIRVEVQTAGWIRGAMDVVLTVRVGGQEYTNRRLVPEFDFMPRFDQYLGMIADEIRDHFLSREDDDEACPPRTEPTKTPTV